MQLNVEIAAVVLNLLLPLVMGCYNVRKTRVDVARGLDRKRAEATGAPDAGSPSPSDASLGPNDTRLLIAEYRYFAGLSGRARSIWRRNLVYLCCPILWIIAYHEGSRIITVYTTSAYWFLLLGSDVFTDFVLSRVWRKRSRDVRARLSNGGVLASSL